MKTIKPGKTERLNNYSEQPLEMSLTGDFNGFYTFLQKVENLPRLTRVTKMQLTKMNDKDGEMQAQMTLSIFFEPDTGSTVAPVSCAPLSRARSMASMPPAKFGSSDGCTLMTRFANASRKGLVWILS